MQELHEGVYPEPIGQISASQKDSHTRNAGISLQYSKVLEMNLHQLPIVDRTVFILAEMEGFNTTEIAAIVNTSPMNVINQLNKAKAIVRNKLPNYTSNPSVFSYNLILTDQFISKVFYKIHASYSN